MFILFLENFKGTISSFRRNRVPDLIVPYFIECCSRDVFYRRIPNLQTTFCLILYLCTLSGLQKYSEKVYGNFLWQSFA